MKLKYFTISLSTIIILIYYILVLLNSRKFKVRTKQFFGLLSVFCYISNKYYLFLSKLITSKVIIAIKNLYGEENLQSQLTIYISKKLFIIFIFSNIILILYSIINKIIILLSGILFIILFLFFMDSEILSKYKLQLKIFKSDLPNFISRLSLLINAGINLRVSIDFITSNTKGEVIEKFKEVKYFVDNGMSEIDAYNKILVKSNDILIRKFISSIIQNIEKGGNYIEHNLELIKKETDEYKKTQMILKAQEANRKLLFPNLLIFLGIMLMVMLPVLLNIM